jgi:dienelactone hydrolase
VHAAVTKPLDWFSIQLARLSVRDGTAADGQLAAAEALLHRREFFADFADVPPDFHFTGKRRFRFTSPVASPWKRNNVVHGRFFPAAQPWTERPTAVLLHGWNAEIGYRTLFPYLARRLNSVGVNAAMFELPYHSQRKPRGRGAARNFISGDLLHVVAAAHQSIADARALVAWLWAQSKAPVGVWGISLGGWLSGVLACVEPRLSFAVLMTPVARMDRVIAELDFCKPIRRRLNGARVRLEPLNLETHRLRLPPQDVLIVASEHDLFAPIETIEELCRAWAQPELWRARHGHISVMMSAPVMERTVGWIAAKAAPAAHIVRTPPGF